MGKTETNTPAKDETAKPAKKAAAPRKMLTPEQRVAKLEAELREAREKAEEKQRKLVDEAKTKRAALVTKRDKLNDAIAELDKVIEASTPAEATVEKTDAA